MPVGMPELPRQACRTPDSSVQGDEKEEIPFRSLDGSANVKEL